jgi:archaellum component FlaF (FlaF/FlaG flagellin family)
MTGNDNNTRKVSEEFVIKVFDKVRDVNEELADDIKELRNAVIGLAEAYNKRYEGQPRPKELHVLLDSWGKTFEIRHAASKEKLEYLEGIISSSKEMLKDHCDHAESEFCSIEEELKQDEGMLKKIKDAIDKLTGRVHIMIVAVLVSLAIFTVAYFFVSHSVDKVVETRVEKIEKIYQQSLQEQLDEINKTLQRHMKEVKK